MPTPASKSKAPPKDGLDLPYTAGDLIPTPEAIEGGESVWALWSEANQQHEARFADTAPASAPMRLTPSENAGWAKTQPATKALLPRRNNRVCPRPERWQEMFALLPPRKTLRGTQQPPMPPLGPAWAVTPPLTKRLCFREHIEWAETQGVLESIMSFMQTMPETDWLHMGED